MIRAAGKLAAFYSFLRGLRMATKAEVKEMAARKLGVLGIGQTLSAEYSSILDDAFDAVFYGLRDDGLNTWAYSAEVPGLIADHFSVLAAKRKPLELGASAERMQAIEVKSAEAMREIRKYLTSRYVSVVNAVDY